MNDVNLTVYNFLKGRHFLQAVRTYSPLLTMNKDWNPLGPFESARK